MPRHAKIMGGLVIKDLVPDPRRDHKKTGVRSGRPSGTPKGRAVASILYDLGYEPISEIVKRLDTHGPSMDDTTFIAANVQLAKFLYPQMANKPFEPERSEDGELIIRLGGTDAAMEVAQKERLLAQGRREERDRLRAAGMLVNVEDVASKDTQDGVVTLTQ
jgi:hypothetical protein